MTIALHARESEGGLHGRAEFGDAIFEALTAELASWMTRELDMAVG